MSNYGKGCFNITPAGNIRYRFKYIEKCVNAHIVAVAFEVQKAECIPMEPWDKPMEMVFTEERAYDNPHI